MYEMKQKIIPHLSMSFWMVLLAMIGLGCSAEPTVKDRPPIYTIQAEDLFSEFTGDESAANEKYGNQVVEVVGKIHQLERDQQGNWVMTLWVQNPEGNIVCKLQTHKSQTLNNLQLGDMTRVKGIVMGYLFDVVLEQVWIVSS